MRTRVPIIVLAVMLTVSVSAESQNMDAVVSGQSVGGIGQALLPSAAASGYRTRGWVRDSFEVATSGMNDLARVDVIWLRALAESGGDRQTALLASLIAVLDHRVIPLSIGIDIPLTFESETEFNARVGLLPRRLYADAPDGDDRDKLQHFFASAWLATSLDNAWLAETLGSGVEHGEDLFVRGGVDDHRDRRTNALGVLFATLLRTYPDIAPSEMFRGWNRMVCGE